MKGSLIIVAFLVAGVIRARWGVLPQELLQQDFSMYVLYGLMFLVGISIGSDRKAWAALKGQQLRIVLVPLATIVGTLAGSIGVSFLLTDIRLTDCLAIGSGFGYYSLSSIFITEYRGAELGTIALTTNIIRDQDAARSGGFCAGWLHRVYLFCREEGLLRHGLLVP